jgi:hypothetical protein
VGSSYVQYFSTALYAELELLGPNGILKAWDMEQKM